jgi:hypothetical protein
LVYLHIKNYTMWQYTRLSSHVAWWDFVSNKCHGCNFLVSSDLFYIPSGLTFKNSSFCPQNWTYVSFYRSKNKQIHMPLPTLTDWRFITETGSVYCLCVYGTASSCTANSTASLKGNSSNASSVREFPIRLYQYKCAPHCYTKAHTYKILCKRT